MPKFQKVLSVYRHTLVYDQSSQGVRKERKNGSWDETFTQIVTKRSRIYAELDCGHTRKQSTDENFAASKRLECHVCQSVAYRQQLLQVGPCAHYESFLGLAVADAQANVKMLAMHKAYPWSRFVASASASDES